MPLTRRSGLCALAVLCAPVPMPAKADAGHAGLAALVVEYEAATALVAGLWAHDPPWDNPEWEPATSACGRLRAAIALYPVASLADVLLKVRACAAHPDPDRLGDLVRQIEGQRGHAYYDDVAAAVVLGLLELREAGACA